MGLVDRVKATQQVLSDGEASYTTGRTGQRFFVTNPTAGTGITAQLAYAVTTPTFLIYNPSSGNRIIPGALTISQTGSVASVTISVEFAIDNIDRFTSGGSGGTAVVAKNTSMASSGTATGLFRYNPTVAAASANVRRFGALSLAANLGLPVTIEFSDAFMIDAPGSVLVYVFAATTAPTLYFHWEWIEERI
jgi:hypothetical protein